MVKSYGPERAVRITLKILRRINLDDLAEKLERDHTGVLLLTSLQELTEDQLKKFQSCGRIFGFPPIPKSQLENTDRQDTVDQMVKRYGLEGAVRNTWRILWRMNLDDLAEKLQRDHTRATTWRRDSSDSDKWRRRKEGLVMRRPSMMDVPALLLTCLEELTEEQLKTFQFYLSSVQLLGLPPIPERQLENTDRQVTVDQMVKRYDPEGAVIITLRILRRMNLDDLAEKLERYHTRVLQELTEDQLKKFQSSGRTCVFPPIPKSQLENTDRQDTVGQMVKTYGPERAVRNTLKILWRIKQHDVAQKLERDHTRATTWWRDSSDSDKWRRRKEGLVMGRPSMTHPVPALLLTTLEELTEEQLKTFQSHLTIGRMLDFPPIPERQLENTDRQNTVDQMVKRYGPEGAVRNIWRILRRMNLDDLAEKLERDHTRGNITTMYIILYITITVQCRSNQKEHSTDFMSLLSTSLLSTSLLSTSLLSTSLLVAPRLSPPRLSSRLSPPRLSSRLSPPRLSPPRLSPPRLSPPRLSPPRRSSPRLSSPRLSSPHLSSPCLSSPCLSSQSLLFLHLRRASPLSWGLPILYQPDSIESVWHFNIIYSSLNTINNMDQGVG
uniref:Pyrin domain-containing protein n=1 Tax=Oncorhynchus tshawytscha TaxID=74940 RepID=A0AAZ3QMX1_ONCTS